VALFSDITPFKDHQKELERIAHFDTLTGLPSRLLLADRLQQSIAQINRSGCSLAVIYLDLDGFKGVNDQYGHAMGDELLIKVAQRMTMVLREGDTLARIGGDEFVVLMADLERPQDCVPLLERLLKAAANSVEIGTTLIQVSASIGVTLYPQDGGDADQLLRHADQAMYMAKQSGKNRYHLFDLAQDSEAKAHNDNLARIRQAIDRHEFVLYYQPQVNMKTGTLIGAEALIRWQHPDKGLLRPAAFLPIVENHLLGVELGNWVLDTVLTQLAEWHAHGFEIPVSVNIGARQLQRDQFLPHLREKLAAYPQISPDHLELEILESSALEDIDHVSMVMHACQGIGVRFSIDDFGTGYSSLTYLKRLPADIIKIDQSFVRDMLDDPEALAIVEAVINLAAAFSRTVIAEGVETAEHGELLLLLGCELAQGYGVAHPMPGAELSGWAKTWRQDLAWNAAPNGAAGREVLPILFAMTYHRAWMRELEACLVGETFVPLPSDQKHCHFAWLEGDGLERWGERAEIQSIAATHHRLHALADELLAIHASGRQALTMERLGELRHLSDALLKQLKEIMLEPKITAHISLSAT
jgi:diguanylate cyclase (GGDEF)-like protein